MMIVMRPLTVGRHPILLSLFEGLGHTIGHTSMLTLTLAHGHGYNTTDDYRHHHVNCLTVVVFTHQHEHTYAEKKWQSDLMSPQWYFIHCYSPQCVTIIVLHLKPSFNITTTTTTNTFTTQFSLIVLFHCPRSFKHIYKHADL